MPELRVDGKLIAHLDVDAGKLNRAMRLNLYHLARYVNRQIGYDPYNSIDNRASVQIEVNTAGLKQGSGGSGAAQLPKPPPEA